MIRDGTCHTSHQICTWFCFASFCVGYENISWWIYVIDLHNIPVLLCCHWKTVILVIGYELTLKALGKICQYQTATETKHRVPILVKYYSINSTKLAWIETNVHLDHLWL